MGHLASLYYVTYLVCLPLQEILWDQWAPVGLQGQVLHEVLVTLLAQLGQMDQVGLIHQEDQCLLWGLGIPVDLLDPSILFLQVVLGILDYHLYQVFLVLLWGLALLLNPVVLGVLYCLLILLDLVGLLVHLDQVNQFLLWSQVLLLDQLILLGLWVHWGLTVLEGQFLLSPRQDLLVQAHPVVLLDQLDLFLLDLLMDPTGLAGLRTFTFSCIFSFIDNQYTLQMFVVG